MHAGTSDDDVRSHLSGLRRPRFFLHFFDIHFLQEKGVARFMDQATREARLATRFSIMLADEVIIPAASFFESKLCRRVLGEFPPDVFGTQIILTGGGSNLEEFIEEKHSQYNPEQAQGHAYRAGRINVSFPWRPRRRSATSDIAEDWRNDLSTGANEPLFRALHGHLPTDHERLWEALPERLGGSAFIVENILPHLFNGLREVTMPVRNRLHAVVNRSYFGSYARDIGAAVFRNMAYLESPGLVPSGDPGGDVDFRRLEQACRLQGVLDAVSRVPSHHLLDLRDDPRFVAALAGAQPSSPIRGMIQGWKAGDGRTEMVLLSPKVLLVTALAHEAAAVLATFDRPPLVVGHRDDPVIYHKGAYVSSDGATERAVLLATLSKMGTDSAATVATHALRTFSSIEHVLMVGIAGGCPNPAKPREHVRLGDIVVSNDKGILDYGHVKQTPDGRDYRSRAQAPSAAMLQSFQTLTARELLGEFPWEGHLARALQREGLSSKFVRPTADRDVLHAPGGISADVVAHPPDPDRRVGQPRVHGGMIGTADILLKDPQLRDDLRDKFGVLAVEMEGTGLQTAAWIAGHDVLVVRGICDYCDSFKNDDWQYYAALAAASFARALVEAMPAEWFE